MLETIYKQLRYRKYTVSLEPTKVVVELPKMNVQLIKYDRSIRVLVNCQNHSHINEQVIGQSIACVDELRSYSYQR